MQARALCATHYGRMARGVDITAPIATKRASMDEIVRRRIWLGTPEECWPAKRLDRRGYGQLDIDRHPWIAHRAAWVVFVGPLDPDVQLHHVCRNRACVNPAHLLPVTPAEHAKLHAH